MNCCRLAERMQGSGFLNSRDNEGNRICLPKKSAPPGGGVLTEWAEKAYNCPAWPSLRLNDSRVGLGAFGLHPKRFECI
jgi:hypothetical protein